MVRRTIFKVLGVLLVLSIIVPFLSAQSFASGDFENEEVVYRDGLFGPATKKVTLDGGVVTYVTEYPWYYFHDGFGSMEITGITGAHSSYVQSDVLYVYLQDDYSSFPVKFTEENLLWITGSFGGLSDGPVECKESRLELYLGHIDGDIPFMTGPINHWDKDGPFAYGESWENQVTVYEDYMRDGYGTYEFTVQEVLVYDSGLLDRELDSDRCWIHVTKSAPEDVADEIGSGSITVNVWDNRVESNQWVEMYKNGKLVDTVYIKGSKTFEDLGFGDYKFVVVKNDDWNTQFTDAVPCQGDFDFDEGTVELSANLNTINYVIWGDDETVDTDPYGDTTDTGSGDYSDDTWDDSVADVAKVIVGDDGDSGDGGNDDGHWYDGIWDYVVDGLKKLGLVSVTVMGLPIFLILLFAGIFLGHGKGGEKNDKKIYRKKKQFKKRY